MLWKNDVKKNSCEFQNNIFVQNDEYDLFFNDDIITNIIRYVHTMKCIENFRIVVRNWPNIWIDKYIDELISMMISMTKNAKKKKTFVRKFLKHSQSMKIRNQTSSSTMKIRVNFSSQSTSIHSKRLLFSINHFLNFFQTTRTFQSFLSHREWLKFAFRVIEKNKIFICKNRHCHFETSILLCENRLRKNYK